MKLVALILGVIVAVNASGSCGWAYEADVATDAFLDYFWVDKIDYLMDQFIYDGWQRTGVTGYWTFAQGFDTVIDAAERNSSYIGWISTFYNAQVRQGWDRPYFDDMNWMALALLRASILVQSNDSALSQNCLAASEYLFNKIATEGWDTTCCGNNKGGIWWDAAHTSKATASNGGPAILGALLYKTTGNTYYLTFAGKFWWNNMVNQSTGQVCDNINPQGVQTWWEFTYNQGLMVGAATALYEATGNQGYLTQAKLIVSYILNSETVSTTYGNILADSASCSGDCDEFKGPTFRYLAYYYKVTGDQAVGNLLEASVKAIWNLGRNTESNCIAVAWQGPAPQNGDIVTEGQTTAAVMALNIYANSQC